MVMRRVVASYFSIVRGTMKDLVPKVIMRFVVNHAVETVHGHLISKILRCAGSAWSLWSCIAQVWRQCHRITHMPSSACSSLGFRHLHACCGQEP